MSRPGKRCHRKCPDSAEADSLRFNALEYAGFLSPLDHASMQRALFKTMPNSPLPLKRRRLGWSGLASQTRDEWPGKNLRERMEAPVRIDVVDDRGAVWPHRSPSPVDFEANIALTMQAVMREEIDLP
jgi:hypothetical protein